MMFFASLWSDVKCIPAPKRIQVWCHVHCCEGATLPSDNCKGLSANSEGEVAKIGYVSYVPDLSWVDSKGLGDNTQVSDTAAMIALDSSVSDVPSVDRMVLFDNTQVSDAVAKIGLDSYMFVCPLLTVRI